MASLSELLNPTGGMDEHDYAQLPSMIEEEYEEEYEDQPGAVGGPDGGGLLLGLHGGDLPGAEPHSSSSFSHHSQVINLPYFSF